MIFLIARMLMLSKVFERQRFKESFWEHQIFLLSGIELKKDWILVATLQMKIVRIEIEKQNESTRQQQWEDKLTNRN